MKVTHCLPAGDKKSSVFNKAFSNSQTEVKHKGTSSRLLTSTQSPVAKIKAPIIQALNAQAFKGVAKPSVWRMIACGLSALARLLPSKSFSGLENSPKLSERDGVQDPNSHLRVHLEKWGFFCLIIKIFYALH